MRRKIKWTVIVLYLATWVGGWITHSLAVKSDARRMWEEAHERRRRMTEAYQKEGLALPPSTSDPLLEGGPHAGVNWCVPLLPGVLLLDSSYVVAPLWGEGGVKVVLYYGFGTKEIAHVTGWRS